MSVKKIVLCIVTALYISAVIYAISIWIILPIIAAMMAMFGLSIFTCMIIYTLVVGPIAFVISVPLGEAAANTYCFSKECIARLRKAVSF